MKKFLYSAFLILNIFNAFCQNEIKNDTITVTRLNDANFDQKQEKFSKFFLIGNYGLGYRTAKISNSVDPSFKSYVKDLKSGTSFDFEIGYRKDKNTTYSFLFSRFNSKGSIGNVEYTEPNGFEGFGKISDDIKINFYGIGGAFNDKGFGNLDVVIISMHLGYIQYVNNVTLTNKYKFSGGNLGINAKVGYYLGITPSIKIGPAISFNGGVIKKFKIEGNGFSDSYKLEDDNLESLYRFDLMIGTLINL